MKKILITILILCLFCSLGFSQAHKGGAHKGGGLVGLQSGAAEGDIVYWNGTAWTILTIGANGTFLSSNGTTVSWAIVANDSSWTSASIDTLNSHLFSDATSGTVDHLLEDSIRVNGSIGINVDPTEGLDVSDNNIKLGSEVGTTARGNNTTKIARFIVPSYAIAEEEIVGFWTSGGNTANTVAYGGGVGTFNSATELRFYTAANTTTLTGSLRMVVDSGGDVGFGPDPTPDATADVQGDMIVDDEITQGVFVIRKHVALSGATDNVATNIFTITTTNETGSADGGMYSVHVHLTAGEATAASGAVNTASVGLGVRWTRIMASAGTGANSAVVEIGETASADEGTGAISAVTVTVTETSEFVQQVLLNVNTSGGTFDGFAIVELVYSDFTTAPVIN